MRKFKPVFWPVPVFVRKSLKQTRRGTRAASNYGLWIVVSEETMEYRSWILEQEKFESRYWFLRGFGLYYLWCKLFYPEGLCRVECMSRAQEIQARKVLNHRYDYLHVSEVDIWAESMADIYADSITNATNYPFFKRAGWDEERVYNEIVRWL